MSWGLSYIAVSGPLTKVPDKWAGHKNGRVEAPQGDKELATDHSLSQSGWKTRGEFNLWTRASTSATFSLVFFQLCLPFWVSFEESVELFKKWNRKCRLLLTLVLCQTCMTFYLAVWLLSSLFKLLLQIIIFLM